MQGITPGAEGRDDGPHKDPALALLIAVTLMATGRAMTIAFLARVGDGGPGDPPAAWLMPLLGDATIGLTAPLVAYLLWKQRTQLTWLIAVIWASLAIFDAVAAFVVESSVPWPEFFMLRAFGNWMFLMAVMLHMLGLYLLGRRSIMGRFGVYLSPGGAVRGAATER